ncbi:hypothetical protein K7432_012051 [Basidiobolus ranarum]|uniref:Disease resistance R13L4/SHOC-2-like LRR domain-containing protein n=1 Tax=Basidiobolus ranarum TaxID=34480 RepID=A0ABR2VSW8_9FUNG
MKLTPLAISDIVNTPLSEVQSLDFSKKEINHIEDISCCVSLRKLNLSQNAIKAADALSGIQYNSELTWLNLSGNQLESLEGIQRLKKLSVLNLSHNKVNRISQHVTNLTALKALILGHNSIKRIENIGNLRELNTIVISHNKLEELPMFPTLTRLTKFSAAHNELRVIPDFSLNSELKELRLNDNKITTIPETLRGCSSLSILDLGNNLIKEWSDATILGSLLHLTNLNLKGNSLCSKDGYREKILKLVPTLRILDGERFDAKFIERKEKKKLREEQLKKAEENGTTEENNSDEASSKPAKPVKPVKQYPKRSFNQDEPRNRSTQPFKKRKAGNPPNSNFKGHNKFTKPSGGKFGKAQKRPSTD